MIISSGSVPKGNSIASDVTWKKTPANLTDGIVDP